MLVPAKLRFRALREPFPYEMDGRSGVSYSFDALDEDDAKCKVKCSEVTYEQLRQAKRDDVIECMVEVFNPKIANGSPIVVKPAVKAA